MTVGERIKICRKKSGIPIETLAEAIGVSRSSMFRYERNDVKKFPVEYLTILAPILGVTVNYLMGSDEESSYLQRVEQLEKYASAAATLLIKTFELELPVDGNYFGPKFQKEIQRVLFGKGSTYE